MNIDEKRRKVIIFLVLVIIIAISLLSIIGLKGFKSNLEMRNIMEQNISASGWPVDVPIIKSEILSISKVDSMSWAIHISKPISYSIFREYLIELYNEGFKPIHELGAESPKLLSHEIPDEEDFLLFWAGMSDNYTIEAFWQENVYQNESGESADDDYVTIFLYSNLDDVKIHDDNNDNNMVDEEVVSGDDLNENVNLSGDTNPSGEILLEDINENEEK